MAGPSSRSARQAAKLEAALSALEVMDLEGLRSRWQALTGRAAPATFRAPLLRAAVAYKLQERALGGLKTSTTRLLHRVADAADPSRHQHPPGPAKAGPTASGPSAIGPSAQGEATTVSAQRRAPAPPLRIKPGTRLLRTWQGNTHEVLVAESSVIYRSRSYRSLSEVARLITGQRWSGPLFFGLKRRAAPGVEPSP